MNLVNNKETLTTVEEKREIKTLLLCSDTQLVSRILQGETSAYEGLMRRYNQRLFRITRAIVNNEAEAMDVMQESYIKAFAQLEKLQNINASPGWLSRIARNEALQYLRQNRRMISMEPDQPESVMELATMTKDSNQPDNELANQQLAELLESSIDKLPDNFRSVFMLRAIEQCSVRETAQILELPEATVKTRYFRANARLQQQLSSHIQDVGLNLYEFAGERCDTVVHRVLTQLN